jgi:5-methylcytosine-specific restriction endonuclease McrA
MIQKRKYSSSQRFQRCRGRTKARGYNWSITKEEWLNLINKPCHYCGISLDGITKGSALDRLNNSKDYDLDNVVPCCYECNMIKGSLLTPEETHAAILAIKQIRAQK